MNRYVFLFLLMLSAGHAAVIYSVDIDRSGFSSVTLSLEGTGSSEVALPEDAKDFRIGGGSFSTVNGTAHIEAGKTGFTTFSFTSWILTEKSGSSWMLSLDPPEGSATHVYMPAHATIESSVPDPLSVSADDSRTVLEFGYSENVNVNYRLGELPAFEGEPEIPFLYLIAGAVILGIALRELFVRLPWRSGPSKKEPRPSLQVTPGKKEIMETFNENDLKIVDFLIESKGKCRRNLLERKTGVSKSSLAMALNRLEKRKIIELDRTSTTHFVKLSDYFLRL